MGAVQMPEINLPIVKKLFEPALMVAVISYMITVSLAQSLAAKNKYHINANQELLALGR